MREYVKRADNPNPCAVVYGDGPAGAWCGSCSLLHRVAGGRKSYFKCDLRERTSGEGSDHRVSWPACAKYEGRS